MIKRTSLHNWNRQLDRDGSDVWHGAMNLWRTVPAEGFTIERRNLVLECMSHISSTMTGWRRAVGGDAAAAVRIAIRMGNPPVLSPKVDLIMTVLLRSAFEDHAAALVLAHRLNAAPLEDRRIRAHLADSWLSYGVWLASRRRKGPGPKPADEVNE